MKKKILILMAFALLAFSCSRTNEVKNTAPVNAPSANTQANTAPEPVKEETFTAGANPRADIISAAQKLQKVPFWSAKIINETNPEKNAEVEYIMPDKLHIKTTKGELIVVGQDAYEFKNGKWQKLEGNVGEYIKSEITSGIQQGVSNLQSVEIVGKEKVNGKDTTIYSHSADGSLIKIWIANNSGLLLKNEDVSVEGKQTRIYDYEKPVKIEAPKID